MQQPEYPMTTVRKDDLDIIVPLCLRYFPDDVAPDVPLALSRLQIARRVGHAEPAADLRPDGFWGRVEIAGYRDATGWVTEQTRFGQQCAVVSDWEGRETDTFILGPNSRVLHLPTPLKRPGPVAALTAGADDDDEDPESYDEDDPF